MSTPHKIKLPKQLEAVEDLLLWRDVPKSAAVVVGATVAFLIVEVSGTPLLTWLANLSAFATLVALVWATASKFVGIPGPSEFFPPLLKSGLDEATVLLLAERARVASNKITAFKRQVLSGTDPALSLKTILVLVLAGFIGRFITPASLAFGAIVAAFTLPKLYELRKDEVDHVAGVARQQVGAQYQVAVKHLDANFKVVSTKVSEVVDRFTPKKGARPAAAEASDAKSD